MKIKYIFPIFLFLLWGQTILGQVYDLSLSTAESGTQLHQAHNSITLLKGYSYTPGGGTMTAEIVSPVVGGSTDYTYNNLIDPASRTINTSYLVGATQGGFNVNALGGATYSIPIDVLPGVNGLAPSLSLVYSSNSGAGVAGWGWSIGGISAISRSPKTFYNEYATTAVDLTANDRFSLDGQRLVLTSGTYGSDLATYQTDIDVFTRVQSQGVNGAGPQKFMSQTKSGLKNLYGATNEGCQVIEGLSGVLNWYLTQSTDLYGNQMNYGYLADKNMVYPAEISYGPNKVVFSYTLRDDISASYVKGKKIQQRLLLNKITVSYNGIIVKTYDLKYNYISVCANNYAELSEVIESGTGGGRLNSTAFSYQNPSNVAMAQSMYNTTNNYVSGLSRMFPGDFNGDGKADFLCLPEPTKGATWTGMKICYSDGNDNFSSTLSLSTTIDLTKMQDIQAMDINGDGRDDILYELVTSGVSNFYYILNNVTSFGSPVLFATLGNGASTGMAGKDRRKNKKQGNDNQITSADYDGDGINDVFINAPNGLWGIYSFSNSLGQLLTTMGVRASGNIGTLTSQTLNGDFNGDGKADIWSIESSGTNIYTFTGTTLSLLYTATWPSIGHNFNLGDFNGDGKVDVFLYGNKSGSTQIDWVNWQIQLSTGNGFEKIDIPQKKINLKDDYIRLGDFNGDGSTDLMVTSLNQSWVGTYFYITQNKGTDFCTSTLPGYPIDSHNYYLADFNGDGRTDFICTDGLSPWWTGYQVYKSPGNTVPLLEKVGNGLNQLTTIAYTKLSQAPTSVYQLGTASVFPVINFQGPLPVVSSITVGNGINGTNSANYYYEGAKIQRQGKGFLGYSKIVVKDLTAGIQTETQSGYNSLYFYPQINTIIKSVISPASAIETTTNTWSQSVLDAPTKRIFPYIQSSSQTNALTGYTITNSVSAVDSYGNYINTSKNYGNGITESIGTSYTNTINSTDWKPGRVDNSTVTYAKSGETSVNHAVRYTYSTDGIMRPDLIYYNEGTSLEYSKNHDYDSKGNLTQLAINGTSIGASHTNYTYDTDGIRVLTVTDALGHVTTNTYDTNGRLATQKDYLNNTNTYQYDALARQTMVSNTNGSQTTMAYVWTGSTIPALGVYGMTQTGNDGSTSTIWYDKLQRAIRAVKIGFGGAYIYTDTEYNAKGQVYRVSVPYFAGGLSWAETYAYDNFGRTTGITRNTGRNTTYSFSGATTTETTASKAFSKTFGPDGTLSSATDNGGTISYNYFPDGKVKNITAPGSVVTTMQYTDAARNQTQLVDPSAGTIGYTYNSMGKLKTQTDARSKLTTYTYLPDGRTDNVVTPEGTTTYSYNTNKQLTGITGPNSVSRTYGYDTKGRVNTVSEIISGATFTTSFTYDTYGRLSTRTHPSGIVEAMGYNTNGYLSTISAGGATRYTITGMNAREQLTGSTYGATLTATYGFDTYGYPTSTATGTVQDYRYAFDPVTGNLNSRQNFKRSLSETFIYDNLERLTSVTGPQNLTMTYNANGNITTKSDIGTTAFGYGTGAGPYALTSVTSSTTAIPAVAQTITYTSFESVATIAEGNYIATIIYNSDNQRAKMDVTQSGTNILSRLYAGSSYMKETAAGVSKEYTYLGGDAYHAPVVAVTQSGATTYYYLLRDYLGNITHVYNASTSTVAEYGFDAWGRRRNPTNWSYDLSSQPELFAGRGFTSHEHLSWFNLVNMNGRLYDPAVGRFISPDPYVQMPDQTQNMNRYTYCMNNPLLYVDYNGYTWLSNFGDWIGGTAKSALNVAGRFVVNVAAISIGIPIAIGVTAITTAVGIGQGVINGNWTILNNEVRIVGGLFTGSPGQILSRFSWELPQTITGYVASQGSNMIGDVKSVNYYDGATVVQHYSADWGGFTIGSYINGDKNIEANPNNELFQHEYGHYLQSQEAGWTYLSNYAIPSGYNGLTCPNGNDLGYYEHMAYSVEQDANIRAKTHFKEAKWDYKSNPIFDSGNNPNFDRDYSIYRTNQGLIRTSWWKSALIMVLCM